MGKRLENVGRRMDAEAYRYIIKEKVKNTLGGIFNVLAPKSHHIRYITTSVYFTASCISILEKLLQSLLRLQRYVSAFWCNFGPGTRKCVNYLDVRSPQIGEKFGITRHSRPPWLPP